MFLGCRCHLHRQASQQTCSKRQTFNLVSRPGTPHTYHYTNALGAIRAGKNVLCEKPVTSNAAELRSLVAAAKEHHVFFMEAMWTRFHPLTLELKKIAEEGSLGAPVTLHADLSVDFDIDSK